MSFPSTLSDIRTKVRRITGRPSVAQITDAELDNYINTFYRFDLPMNLKMESLRYNYEFTSTPNIAVYDFPRNTYTNNMPPVYIAGYRSYMTQSRENFFRVSPQLNFLQQSVMTGNGGIAYTGTLINIPVLPGFKPNPPGAYSTWTAANDIPASELKWNVLISASGTPDATSGIAPQVSLVDDGQGNLFDPTDASINPANARGTINYITGAISITNFRAAIPTGNAINVQYIPYKASRPQQLMFFQDQFILWPVPDQAYTVSIEAYKYPTAFTGTSTEDPQLQEWWQLLAYGAASKIFADNADFENLARYQPLLNEQMTLVQRRTIVQQTSERTATIYTEQTNGAGQFPFGNIFSGF